MQTPTQGQGMTRAQANAARSTCTACHQRKVKCDAHDRGYPCTRCRKNGNESDCRLHKKNKRVSRAKQQARQSTSTQDVKPLSPAPPQAPASIQQHSSPVATVHESIVAVAAAPTPAAAATPGSLFLQTVIAEGDSGEHVEHTAPQEPASTPRTPLDRIEHNDRFDHDHDYDHAPHSDTGTAGSTTTTTASTPAVLPSHGADGEYKKYLVEFIDQPQLAERPIDKTARILYVGSSLSNIHFLLRQRMSANGANPKKETNEENVTCASARKEDTAVHYPTNRIAKPSAGLGALAADGLPLEAFQLPPKRTVDQLLGVYLQHINPGFPVVDGRLFMRQYRARDPANPPSLLLLQAMLVAGAHVLYKDDPDTRHTQKAVFFRRAKMLLDARVERNRDTVVQAALLLTWHADGPEDVAANAWHWVGLAARTATGLGMHRDADGSTLVAHNKRMWRRVWWLLVACDVLVALQYGRPPALHLDDTDVAPLTASDFVDCGSGTRVDYVLHLVQLCILLSTHVLRRQFRSTYSSSSREKDRQSALRRTDEALANWSLHLPPSLQLSGQSDPTSSSASTSINVWTASLHLTYNTALLLLHRQAPSPHAALDTKIGGPSPDDVEICTNAAVAIQQIFHAVCASGQAVYLWSSSINSLFTALIQLSGDVQRSTSTTSAPTIKSSSSKSRSRGNPLLAVAALRRYDAALASLRQLAAFWPNAQAVVQFFEQSVRTGSASAAQPTSGDASATSEEMQHSGSNTTTTTTVDSTRHTTPVPDLPQVTESVTVTKDFAAYPSVDPSADMHLEMDTVDSRLSHSHSQSYEDHHMPDHHVSSHGPSDPDMAQHLLSSFVAAARPMLPFEGHHHHHHGHTPPMADPWNAPGANADWQCIYWQQPELTDDFLFSF
ncbi:hypothetical protein Sste5346_006243 [Sporothrix stenoceras]|uniref:Zn(2)-C6 fungal-type domain-containing protein n=1 Tax=Sporothrix stenoceras TaxID=5173 RepID=A0ABR3Z0N4_9PEZI